MSQDRTHRWARPRGLTPLFALLATVFGLSSLAYPFGRDQGLFFYAAREWLLRGQVLYRDVWDHKPPLIYFIHLLTIAVFGPRAWGIRVVELFVAVPALAIITARLATPRGKPIPSGSWGAAWLGVAVTYYGYWTFWDTAQCEIWSVLFATLALACAWHAKSALRGSVAAGVLCALALFTKPPIFLFVLLCAVAVCLRARQQTPRSWHTVGLSLLAFGAGGLICGGALLGYFALRHALAPMMDILVGANAVYVDQERGVHGFWEFFGYPLALFSYLEPYSLVFTAAFSASLFLGIARRDRTLALRYALPFLLILASYGAVAVQLKFFLYHWGTLVAPAGVTAALLFEDLRRAAGDQERARKLLAPLAFLAIVPGLFVFAGASLQRWLDINVATVRYEAGSLDRESFSRLFDVPFAYAYHDAEQVGLWVRAHSSPEDTIVVRGFEPEIYAISGRHFTGRFFWTTFLTAPTRQYHRAEWLAEDLGEIQRRPPRYAITGRYIGEGIDSPAWFERLGYVKRIELGLFAVMEYRGGS